MCLLIDEFHAVSPHISPTQNHYAKCCFVDKGKDSLYIQPKKPILPVEPLI
jgi:hypothetical protein